MSYLRADVFLSFFHTEIRSRAQYARRIFPQRKRRLRASYLLERYPVALFPFLFISAGSRRKGGKLFFKTPPSASYVSSKRSPRFHPRAADTSQFFGQSFRFVIRLSIFNPLSRLKARFIRPRIVFRGDTRYAPRGSSYIILFRPFL